MGCYVSCGVMSLRQHFTVQFTYCLTTEATKTLSMQNTVRGMADNPLKCADCLLCITHPHPFLTVSFQRILYPNSQASVEHLMYLLAYIGHERTGYSLPKVSPLIYATEHGCVTFLHCRHMWLINPLIYATQHDCVTFLHCRHMWLISPLIYATRHGCVTSLHWILFSLS